MKLFPLDCFPADRAAAIDDLGQVLSYGELALACSRLKAKVPPRAVALVLTRNTLGCIAAIVALIKGGRVPILLDASAAAVTVKLYLDRYQPEVLVLPAASQTEYSAHAVLLNMFDYTVLETRFEPSLPLPNPDLALLLSTSGSTGNPKLVRQSYQNLLSNTEAIIAYLRIGPNDRPVTSLPLHYTYGFSILSSHLHAGATLLVTEYSIMEKPFWEFFNQAAASSLAGVPYTYQMLKRLGFLNKPPRALRTLTQAGGKMTEGLARDFAEYADKTGIDFFVMYGQTEATARISYVPAERALEKAGSIGVAIPGGELFLVNPTGDEITATGVEGQLGYRGANVTMGYAENRAELTLGDERHGTLLTGDLARRDSEGYYYITGRLSRFVKLYGKRVSLEDLEQICLSLVPEVACLGTEDRVIIFITDGQHKAVLPRLLAERTATHASAYDVRVIDCLPRNAAGKTDYRALSKEVLA